MKKVRKFYNTSGMIVFPSQISTCGKFVKVQGYGHTVFEVKKDLFETKKEFEVYDLARRIKNISYDIKGIKEEIKDNVSEARYLKKSLTNSMNKLAETKHKLKKLK